MRLLMGILSLMGILTMCLPSKKALEILRRHSAYDVHLHQIPDRTGKLSDVPQERSRIIHILERPPELETLPPESA